MKSFQALKRNLRNNIKTFSNIRVAVLGDTSTQFLSTAIKGMGVERGYNIILYEAEYNQVEIQILDVTSDLYQFDAEFIIVFQSTHKLLEKYNKVNTSDKKNIASDRIDFIEMICDNISAKIIYYNYPEIDDVVFGNFSNQVEESFLYQNRKLNFQLMQLTQKYANFYICDISSIQNKIGRNSIFDPSIYISADMVLSINSLPIIASRTLDIICVHKGSFKKCLILDLDNTLWGGIIGDDGIENIQIGHGLGIGKAFTEFQEWIKKLKERGIILAICSKNTESIAKEPFENHSEMVLHLDDIAVFVSNWDNKVDNIRKIQSILNISFDSMVFLDDNPFERNIVRENIEGIIIPELPVDPANYLEFLYGLNLFETVSYSDGDKNRTKQYQVDSQRVLSQMNFCNENDFLKSLNMVSVVEGFTKFNRSRIAQLSQRSNQFNLRTVRYYEGDIEKLSHDASHHCFSFTLEDKFGDNGLISLIIMQTQDFETLFIETFLMSCRVLKRGMENFAFNTIVEYARNKGFKKIIGEYIPTNKNMMVADFYSNMGFKEISMNHWGLFLDQFNEYECFINAKKI